MTEEDRAANVAVFEMIQIDAASQVKWKRGLPPGAYYDGMSDDFEVVFTAGGSKWHRRRSTEDAAEHRRLSQLCASLRAKSAEAKSPALAQLGEGR